MKSKVQEKREYIAKTLGVEPEDVKAAGDGWSRLMQSGVIVNIHLGRIRGDVVLTNDDLGLPRDAHGELITLGTKKVLPPKRTAKLQSIEVSARGIVRNRAIPTGWGMFVPESAFAEVIGALRAKKTEYMAEIGALAFDRPAWMPELLASYAKEARGVYRRAMALAVNGFVLRTAPSEDEFVSMYTEAIRIRIPTSAEISAAGYFDIEMTYVPLPSLLAEDYATGERVREDARQSAAMDYMNREVLRSAREQKERLVGDFLAAVVGELRQRTYDVMVQAQATVRKNGTLQARTVVALRNWIETVKALDFYGDKEIDEMVARIRPILSAAPESRPLEAVLSTIDSIADDALAGMLAVGVKPRNRPPVDEFAIEDFPAMKAPKIAAPDTDDIAFAAPSWSAGERDL